MSMEPGKSNASQVWDALLLLLTISQSLRVILNHFGEICCKQVLAWLLNDDPWLTFYHGRRRSLQ
jgi:hypothetical protein